MRTPCEGFTRLYEPFLRPGETLTTRGVRLAVAAKVCEHCPLAAKQRCSELAKGPGLTRGVWGGKVVREGGITDD